MKTVSNNLPKQLLFLISLMLMIAPACKRHPKHPNIAQGVAIATGSALTITSIPMMLVAADFTAAASTNIIAAIIFFPITVGIWATAGACLIVGVPLILTGALTLKDAEPTQPEVSTQVTIVEISTDDICIDEQNLSDLD